MAIGANTLRNDPSVSHTKYPRRGKECTRSSFPMHLKLVAYYTHRYLLDVLFCFKERRDKRKGCKKEKNSKWGTNHPKVIKFSGSQGLVRLGAPKTKEEIWDSTT